MKFVSILMTHWSDNDSRSGFLRKSLESLKMYTTYPYELIVVDNGEKIEDSQFLLDLAHKGDVNTYIRNHNNMHFGFARNQALRVCNGDYMAIVDNDIIYNPGWLEACIDVLEQNPDKKIYATPVYNVAHWRPKYWQGSVEANGKEYKLNMRAGSNAFVIRREDMEYLGDFWIHRVAGTHFTNAAVRSGYLAAVTPEIMVNDFGFRKGYNLNESKPVKVSIHNGDEIYFNGDEFKKYNPDKNYMNQKTFISDYEKEKIKNG